MRGVDVWEILVSDVLEFVSETICFSMCVNEFMCFIVR
jgi:hypothetical protein